MENLTMETFKTKIFDFENNKEWKFLGDKPTILKFGAVWCGPCKQIEPILVDLSKEYENRLDIYSIDVDNEHELSGMFNIKSVPTLLFIPLDEEPKMLVGGIGKDKFKTLIKDVLKVEE